MLIKIVFFLLLTKNLPTVTLVIGKNILPVIDTFHFKINFVERLN